MAHIFKEKTESQKGIVVFTHKELNYFEGNLPSWKELIKKPKSYVKKFFKKITESRKIKKNLLNIKKNYYIGVHWGFHSVNIETPEWVDFHMSAPGTCTFNDAPFVIPLSSANFTPRIMRDEKKEKYWDVICVAKNDNKKRYPELLRSIRKVYDLGYKFKIIFVVASNKNEPSALYYGKLLKDYNEMFSAEEREIFTIIKTHPDTGFQGFSYTFLSHLYNESKVFTIFSQKEGECRVIKEAQLCGLPVVVKSDMQGGGRDFLNKNNSVMFDEYQEAHNAIIEAVENYKDYTVDSEKIESDLGEESSIRKLNEYFSQLYSKEGKEFDGELINTDNLNRRLPAHFFDEGISWAKDPEFRFSTTDITNKRMFYEFKKTLN
ncbi:glycosyltransferase [Idiomarina sp.]|uniref:glycosyltransferase n=1 Tax=Idiomarina sp. TaxID=1874361 RepID=UPI003A8F1D86